MLSNKYWHLLVYLRQPAVRLAIFSVHQYTVNCRIASSTSCSVGLCCCGTWRGSGCSLLWSPQRVLSSPSTLECRSILYAVDNLENKSTVTYSRFWREIFNITQQTLRNVIRAARFTLEKLKREYDGLCVNCLPTWCAAKGHCLDTFISRWNAGPGAALWGALRPTSGKPAPVGKFWERNTVESIIVQLNLSPLPSCGTADPSSGLCLLPPLCSMCRPTDR